MKLRLEFGIPATKKREIAYYGGYNIEQFHRFVLYKGILWEFINYDKDKTGSADYVLLFGEINEAPEGAEITDLELRYGNIGFGTQCECGAVYQRGFEHVHSFWCPRWEKI